MVTAYARNAPEFPAHAGMNRSAASTADMRDGVPRTRGDEPWREAHTRRGSYEFPAHAGMNRRCATCSRLRLGVPRTRGDEPVKVVVCAEKETSSPHTRG